jgi:alkanesulfonate monooxygenase SsuD/methylene tetrahydromethanopterin reductase-like flavin-dependent oxidoreductase (luciferase family)
MLGMRPTGARAMREYVRVVRALLHGEEVGYHSEEGIHPIRFTTLEQTHVKLDPPPPVHIAGNGPLSQALAGELADGLCTTIPRGGTIGEAMSHVKRGAAKAGRMLPDNFHTAALVNVLMLEPGEALTSPRVIAEIGPAIMTNFHYLVDWVRETGKEPPAYVRPVWNDYTAFLKARAAADSHLTMHASHYATLTSEEARFLTPEIIRNFCLIGQPAELVEQLRELERQGLKQITFHPPFAQRYEVMERFAKQVMARM